MADSGATAGLRYVDPPTNRNLIINGAMQVAQRGTSTTSLSSTSSYNTADRWRLDASGVGTWTQSVENDAPTGSGLRKSLKMLCTTAAASPSAGGYLVLTQPIEGQDLQRVAKGTASAQQLTISFWVKSNVTGTYVAQLADLDNSRAISATYSVSASATWEKKTITFAADTTGAFDNDNAGSLRVNLWLGAGSDRTSGTLQTTWGTEVNANIAPGQTNLAAATNNYWQVTAVQLETGPVATPFEFEPYEATLRKCQRYYYRSAPSPTSSFAPVTIFGAAKSTTVLSVVVAPPVTMRAIPSSVAIGNIKAIDAALNSYAITAAALIDRRPDQVGIDLTSSSLTQHRPYYAGGDNNTSAFLALDAEL
jgi:hypothetical protein